MNDTIDANVDKNFSRIFLGVFNISERTTGKLFTSVKKVIEIDFKFILNMFLTKSLKRFTRTRTHTHTHTYIWVPWVV